MESNMGDAEFDKRMNAKHNFSKAIGEPGFLSRWASGEFLGRLFRQEWFYRKKPDPGVPMIIDADDPSRWYPNKFDRDCTYKQNLKSISGNAQEYFKLPRGSVTDEDWEALVRTMYFARQIFGENRDRGAKLPFQFLEVGTLGGKTTRGIGHFLSQTGCFDVDIVTIDKDSSRHNESVLTRLQKVHKRIKFHTGTTVNYPFVEDSIAWAFIDGCHCFDCVVSDLMNVGPHVKNGGIICLHDACEQQYRGMLVHERYHDNDGIKRLYGVSEAIQKWLLMDNNYDEWVRVERVPASNRPPGAPTPLFGGIQAYQKVVKE